MWRGLYLARHLFNLYYNIDTVCFEKLIFTCLASQLKEAVQDKENEKMSRQLEKETNEEKLQWYKEEYEEKLLRLEEDFDKKLQQEKKQYEEKLLRHEQELDRKLQNEKVNYQKKLQRHEEQIHECKKKMKMASDILTLRDGERQEGLTDTESQI